MPDATPTENHLNIDRARAEAKLIQDKYSYYGETVAKTLAAENPELKNTITNPGSAGLLEIGSQVLDGLREKAPDIYEAEISRELSFERLAETIAPSYMELDWTHYLSPGEALKRAEQLPFEKKREAFENAAQKARILVSSTVDSVIQQRKMKNQKYPDPVKDLVETAKVVAGEVEDGHMLKHDASPTQTAALVECTLSTLYIKDKSEKIASLDFGLEETAILAKQRSFDRSK